MSTDLVKSRKKKGNTLLKIVLIVGFSFIGILAYGVYWAFFDMNRLPTGEYVTEQTSPDGTYTLKAYIINGGATTSYSIRGELVFNNRNEKTKNVYWNYREETATIQWIDDDTVKINGHELNVPNERFDFRRQ